MSGSGLRGILIFTQHSCNQGIWVTQPLNRVLIAGLVELQIPYFRALRIMSPAIVLQSLSSAAGRAFELCGGCLVLLLEDVVGATLNREAYTSWYLGKLHVN